MCIYMFEYKDAITCALAWNEALNSKDKIE